MIGWLKMLRTEGAIPVRAIAGDVTIEAEISAFDRHLVEARGLQPATRIVRRSDALALLTGCKLRGGRTPGRPAHDSTPNRPLKRNA
jgi:hypothetical protein